MKKTKLFGWAFVATMMGTSFSACTNDLENPLARENEIKLTSEIVPSRVTSLDYQSTQIVEGQQVGVTITGAKSEHNNVAWTAGANGVLTNTETPIYFGNGQATITAYHPYNSAWTGTSHDFSVSTDQSTDTEYLASDLLWATATSSKTESAVPLVFKHKLAKINVTLTSEDITDLSNAIISICGTNIATNFNPADGTQSAATANVAEIVAGVTTTSAYTASAIVVPQTVVSGTKFIKVEHNSKKFYYTLNADKSLKPGYSYSYKLNIKEAKVEVDLESDNITNWDDEEIEGDMDEEVTSKKVIVNNAGTLSNLITSEEKKSIKTLIVSGSINGDDVRFIREMAGFDIDGNETDGQLVSLDLSNADIVAGGGPYINKGASFWGFEYDDEGSQLGQWVLETKYTKENNSAYMFIGLKQLELLILPKSLVNLGEMTFYGCHKLKSLTLPASINYSLSYSQYFHACLGLETINVEEGNPSLFSRDGVLYENNEGIITLLAIPAARKTFTITSDIDQIASYAVPLGSSLEELIITEDAPELKPYFYDNLFFLQNFIVDENNKRYATIDGVLHSKDLSTIECYPSGRAASSYAIPQGVTAIGNGCFNTSWHLSEIIIPEGVETIGESAFFDCHNLHELTLPTTIKTIGASAFQHLHMTKFTCKSQMPPVLYDDYVFVGNYEKICVPAESVELYKNAEYWNKLAEVIYPIE